MTRRTSAESGSTRSSANGMSLAGDFMSRDAPGGSVAALACRTTGPPSLL